MATVAPMILGVPWKLYKDDEKDSDENPFVNLDGCEVKEELEVLQNAWIKNNNS